MATDSKSMVKADSECSVSETKTHIFSRVTRPQPSDPNKTQDAVVCLECDEFLYPWQTILGGRG